MSIIKLGPDNFERFTVIARPRRYFSSSSSGVTGSVPVFPRLSTIEKEVVSASFGITAFSEETTLSKYSDLFQTGTFSNSSVEGALAAYTSSFTTNANRSKKMEVTRFVPPFLFDTGSLKKTAIRQNLFRYHKPKNPYADWSFTNYQCLNFFSSSTTLTSSALVYKNSNFYAGSSISGQFSFDFYINPRYKPSVGEEFKAGTIVQVSGTHALSLITGSHRDEDGRADKFKLQFQIGSVASNQKPSIASGPNVFTSDDNVLSHNCWHHVVVRWSSSNLSGYGSFVVDGVEVGQFSTADLGVMLPNHSIVIGNYFEGLSSNLQTLSTNLLNDAPNTFSHLLRSEIHEIKLWNKYLSDSEISYYQSNSVGATIPESLSLYVPVLFTSQSYQGSPPTVFHRIFENQSSKPSVNRDYVTQRAGSSPYNSLLHFNTNEIEINVENYVRDFVSGFYPRLYNLTGSTGTSLYDQPKFRKRNLTILPCDNGKIQLDYGILISGSLEQRPPSVGSPHSRFVNDFGTLDLSLVSLKDVIPSASLLFYDYDAPGFEDALGIFSYASDPYTSTAGPYVPSGYLSTRDNSSDAVVFFDSSNLFYGSRIHPGSLTLIDPSFTGSDGEISITLKDNGFGGLYRADALTPHATWAGVGTVLYDEGIAVVKSPMLAHFGTSSYTMEMRGERPVHVMQIAVPCPAGQVNSSSNPTFQPLTASDVPSETSVGPVIITGINFHDDNLNVVARSQLAQPIVKRSEDRFLFRTKIDW